MSTIPRCCAAAFLAVLSFVPATTAVAQLAGSATPGDRVVYTIGGGALLGQGLGTSVVHDFDDAGTVVLDLADSFDLGADGGGDDTKIFLTGGHHLVLYGTDYDLDNDRSGLDSVLRVNGTAIPYGASAGYARDTTNDKLFCRGGTILNVAQGDYLELETARTDNEPRDIVQQGADLQLIALDDSYVDFLRLGIADTTQVMWAYISGPQAVAYDVVDELDAASFAHDAGTAPDEITLKTTGHYLVMVNTGFTVFDGAAERNVLTQDLLLNGAPLNGGSTTVYLRHAAANDGLGGLIDTGAASLGVLVEVTVPNSILQVRVSRDNEASGTQVRIDGARSGLAIAKLPVFGDYLTLQGGPQAVNVTPAAPRDFSASANAGNASFTYDSGASASEVSINQAGDYVFLSSHYGMADAAASGARSIVKHTFRTTPAGGSAAAVSYGHGGAYNRDEQVGTARARFSGGWAGAILSLGAGDTVEATTEQQGGGGTNAQVTTSSLGLQAMSFAGVSGPPDSPFVFVNAGLAVSVNDPAVAITSAELRTIDANTGDGFLVYTVSGTPVGGTLRLGAASLGDSDTFTQADLNAGSVTFEAGPTANPAGGFSFSVSDGSASAGATFVVNIVPAIGIGNDSGTTGEDSAGTTVDPGATASLLANDTGDGLTVTAFDAASAQGAAVNVNADGTFGYDPGAVAALQAGASGGNTADSFTYTVTDAVGKTAVGTVNMTVAGADDGPVAVDDSFGTTQGSAVGGNVLSNDTDPDAGDAAALVVTEVDGDPAKLGTPIPTVGGGTVTLNANGSFTYDPGNAYDFLGAGETGYDSFTYLCEDPSGLASLTTAASIIAVSGADDGVTAPAKDYTIDNDAVLVANFVLDDTGNGPAVSIDANEILGLSSVNVAGLQGSLNVISPNVVAARGTVSVTDAVQSVNYGITTFTNPVVIAGPPTVNGSEPAIVRITNVNAAAGTFDIQIVEQPEGGAASDGDGAAHAAEDVSWLVIEAGNYVLPNGARMEAGTVSTNAIRHSGGPAAWEFVTFTTAFPATPAFFHMTQTLNGTPTENAELFGTRAQNVINTSFEVALEDIQGDSAARGSSETIGWLAIETGVGSTGGNLFEAGQTGTVVNNGFYTIGFAQNYGSAPDFLASQNSYFGGDPAQVRSRNLGGTSAEVQIDEDTFGDTETGHLNEIVHFLAIGGSGTLEAYPLGTLPGTFTYNPSPAFDSLPNGATATDTFTYTVTDRFGNTATETVTITIAGAVVDADGDGIPDEYELANGLNPNDASDAGTDPDGDGRTALEEYLTGTLENNAASVFALRVTAVDEAVGTSEVRYGPVFAGFRYELSATCDIGIFSQSRVFEPAADAAEHIVTDFVLLDFEGYKVEVHRP